MGENNEYDIWGSSLSLRPPTTNHHNENAICKREYLFSTEEQSSKMHKPNATLMIMPRMEMDVNQPLVIDLEENVEISKDGSPNSTLSSNATGKRVGGFRRDRDVSSDDEEGGSGGGGGERKKLRLSKEQIIVLEQAFAEHTTLNTRQKVTLARQVNLRPRQVEVWFQNRRARTKLKQTEVDCEYLRRFCEKLTEQNRKLQKEVQELRALNVVSPDKSVVVHGKNINPPGNTLNMCPSCKTVSLSSSFAVTTNETGRYLAGVIHRPAPVNLKKLSLTINNNMMFESHLHRS